MSARSDQRADFFAFADGLQALFAGEDDPRADAAAAGIAEILILHRMWLESHKER